MVDLDDPVVYGFLLNLVGEEGMDVIKKMPEGEVTDDEVAEATGVLLNIVRRTLFILFENRLAVYRRVRNKDSGWLTYLWRLDFSNINDMLDRDVKKLVRNLEARLEFEDNNMFYICAKRCQRYIFEKAAENEFLCAICEEDVFFEDNEPFKQGIRKRIKELTEQ